jgi:hypothetical protein
MKTGLPGVVIGSDSWRWVVSGTRVTKSRHLGHSNMKMKYLLITAVGLWTAIVSFWVITPAITALRSPESSDIAITLLVLGVLLALGGSRLALSGVKHLKHAT